jgi:biopolymer transport protein ExbB
MNWFLLVTVVVAMFSSSLSPTYSWAADDKEKAVAADAGQGAKEEAKPTKSYMAWFIESSGLIGLVILVLSIYFVATTSRLFFDFRMPIAIPPEIHSRCQELLGQRDFKGIFAILKEDDSFFSRMVSTGITELPNGLAEARDVMERVGESIRVEMEKRISMLAVLGTLGPMIGLLGTLKGMIASFSVIAMSDVQMKASAVAGGISEALLLTFEGVALSVPSIYFFSLFRNRVSVIATTTGLEADQFLRQFAHAARTKQSAAGAAPTTTTPAAPR